MSHPITQAVLLVGGEGTRLRPLTLRRPKALVPLLNRPLLSYELQLLARHGITDVILAVGYKADALAASLGNGSQWGVRLTYVEDPIPLGTAGGIGNVRDLLHGHFVAMNGDLVYDVDLTALVQAHLDSAATMTFCLRHVDDISRFGLIPCDPDGWVAQFLEKRDVDPTGQNRINSGVYVMSPEVLDAIPPGQTWSSEAQLFPGLLNAGKRLRGYEFSHQGYWADVGTRESYLQTSRDLLGGAIPWIAPEVSSDLSAAIGAAVVAPVHIAEGVIIETGATVGPNVTLGPGCHIGTGCILSDCIVWEGVTVGPGCYLENCIIADGETVPAGLCQTEGVIAT